MDSTSAVLAVHGGGEGLICLADRESTDYYCTHEQIERGDQAAGWRLESPDLRFSLARFTVGRQRTITELIGLSAVSTELRPAAPGRIPHAWQRSRDPSAVAAELIERAGISAKATIAAAGDGLRITVAHGHLPRQAAPRWQALQHEFTRLLAPLGAVAETRITQMIPAGRVLAVGERGDFEQLCERLLPLTRDECHEARRRRVERFAYGSEGSKLWWRRLAEIREWCKRCWPAGVPPEYRQRVLFIMCNAIGWSVADPREMPGEIHALATEIMPGMPGWAVEPRNCSNAGSASERRVGTVETVQIHKQATESRSNRRYESSRKACTHENNKAWALGASETPGGDSGSAAANRNSRKRFMGEGG
ncbi:MAG: hypothetical protein V9E89_15260 [Ilumatobacteraceae bacterium]